MNRALQGLKIESLEWNEELQDWLPNIEKFAQLIIKECSEIALLDGQTTGNFEVFNKITKHFGVVTQ